ncbi:sigma-70 family RNA polymerase sigma factor [Nocardia otitidiscaviarum]|uniref:RNA polymerase sigma factor n=1 Tax=Nocardia otitidiscaviarum TaxID=1823 RepID=UPI0004A726C0|nr:sigma-70 family RNA polymerase sigma factor [Nocardia otitidiscaviarum]MBF6137641.1 sigma-70 family RNA polymerase sigma factor [Nocardia otitidiscaviarum]MBF6488549.1 sigma-70 family RNA polymerase sigma factor [Nocardia otitidiscaviarum]
MDANRESAAFDAELAELLGELLRECAHEPLLLISSPDAGSALVRIARDGAPAPSRFDELLVEVYETERLRLIGWTVTQVPNRSDAEDIVQTALVRTYAARPDVRDTAAMRGYLWRVTGNLIKDGWKRTAADRAHLDPDGQDRIVTLADRAGIAFDEQISLRHALITALEQLPPREREAVVLHTYAGNTYVQTAAMMGLAAGTVKAYVAGALAKVRAQLQAA